jgi:predicted GNAT family acetyltransferase
MNKYHVTGKGKIQFLVYRKRGTNKEKIKVRRVDKWKRGKNKERKV